MAALINPAASDDSSDAAMRLMVSALDELKAAGRLRTSAESAVFSQVLWATLHGIVALNLTCPVFPTAPLGTIIDAALDAWFGEREPPAASRDAPVVVATAANDIPADGPAAPATPSATAPRARRPAAKRKAAGA